MDQQCGSKTSYRMFKVFSSGPNSCPHLNSRLVNRVINDRLLDA